MGCSQLHQIEARSGVRDRVISDAWGCWAVKTISTMEFLKRWWIGVSHIPYFISLWSARFWRPEPQADPARARSESQMVLGMSLLL